MGQVYPKAKQKNPAEAILQGACVIETETCLRTYMLTMLSQAPHPFAPVLKRTL